MQLTTLSSVNKAKQDLPVTQKSNCERRLQLHRHVSEVIGLEKQARKTSNFIFRDDMSKTEHGLNVRPLFTCTDYFASEDAKV